MPVLGGECSNATINENGFDTMFLTANTPRELAGGLFSGWITFLTQS